MTHRHFQILEKPASTILAADNPVNCRLTAEMSQTLTPRQTPIKACLFTGLFNNWIGSKAPVEVYRDCEE